MFCSTVAIHGLGADPEWTWRRQRRKQDKSLCSSGGSHAGEESDSHVSWLRDFLAEDFPTARVMTFGYNADWIGRSLKVTADERGIDLLNSIKDFKTEQEVWSGSNLVFMRREYLSRAAKTSYRFHCPQFWWYCR